MALKDTFELYDGTGVSVFGANWRGQTFTTTSAYSITDVALSCWKFGSPGNITVSIRAVDGNGKPTGADLASVTVADSVFSTLPTRAWYTFTFDTPYDLDDATKYAIIFRAPSGNASNSFTVFGYDSAGYANGEYTFSVNSGSSWNFLDPNNRDLMFRTYGDLIPPGKATTPTPTDDQEDIKITGIDQLKILQWEAPA